MAAEREKAKAEKREAKAKKEGPYTSDPLRELGGGARHPSRPARAQFARQCGEGAGRRRLRRLSETDELVSDGSVRVRERQGVREPAAEALATVEQLEELALQAAMGTSEGEIAQKQQAATAPTQTKTKGATSSPGLVTAAAACMCAFAIGLVLSRSKVGIL